MSEIGDSNSDMVKNKDILVNTNGKGSTGGDVDITNRFDGHRDISWHDNDELDDYSNKSEVDSTKFREVDRFGFIGGNQYTDPTSGNSSLPLEIWRMRELKWLDMMENWEKWMSKRFRKVKERCRKGIPDSLRARAWQLLTGSAVSLAANPGRYQGYIESHGNPLCLDEIKKDVSRQYPHHELFMDDQGQGQEDLYSVLMAYSVHDPTVGYCQAQGPLAAVLLTLMPAEQAFWCFLTLCEKYLPGYYNTGLESVQIDSLVLFGLLKKACPSAYKHLKQQKVEPILWMTDWFMCLFSRTLPWPSVLRVWDMFLCEGVKVMFRVALVLVKSVLGTSDQINKCPTFYDSLDKLRKIPSEFMEENYLVREMSKLQITDREMEKEHAKQLKKWNASKSQKNQKNNSSQIPSISSKDVSHSACKVDSLTPNSDDAVDLIINNEDLSKLQTTDNDPSSSSSHQSRPPKYLYNPPILPPPGSLLLPRAITSSPKPLISLPESTKMMTTNPAAASQMEFQRSTSTDENNFKPVERTSKRFAFSSKKSEKNKLSSSAKQDSVKSHDLKVNPGLVANDDKFKRFHSKPSISPCSSFTAVPQSIDKKKKTFHASWRWPKTSKSTTHIDQ